MASLLPIGSHALVRIPRGYYNSRNILLEESPILLSRSTITTCRVAVYLDEELVALECQGIPVYQVLLSIEDAVLYPDTQEGLLSAMHDAKALLEV